MEDSQIRKAAKDDKSAWNDFVSQRRGSIFQTFEWGDVIEETFKYKRYYLIAGEKTVSGVLPLFHVKSMLENKISSIPMSDTGGPLGDDETKKKMIEEVQQIMVSKTIDYFELKDEINEMDFKKGRPFYTFTLDLNKKEDELWETIGKKNRNLVRKAQKSGVTVEAATSENDIKDFYRIYSKTMKKLGTPPYSKSFYRNMWARLNPLKKIRILFAVCKGERIAGTLFLLHNNVMYYFSGVSLQEYLHLDPNNLLLYEGMKWGSGCGMTVFDFGRTSTEGVYNFKKSWGGTPKEYHYYYKFIGSEKETTLSKDYSMFSSIWKTLLPLPLTTIVGPQLRRMLGY